MRRAKSKQESDFEKALKALQEIQEKTGTSIDLDRLKDRDVPNIHQQHAEQHEIDAVLLSLHKPHAVKVRPCTYCKEPFGTTYCYVGYCSQHCRVKALAEFGIELDAARPIWGDNVEPPAIITPQMLVKMERWANQILEQLDQIREKSLQSLADLSEVEFDRPADAALQQEPETLQYQPPAKESDPAQSSRLELLASLELPEGIF